MQYQLYAMGPDGLTTPVPLRKLFWRCGPSYGRHVKEATGTIADDTPYVTYLTRGDVFEARP